MYVMFLHSCKCGWYSSGRRCIYWRGWWMPQATPECLKTTVPKTLTNVWAFVFEFKQREWTYIPSNLHNFGQLRTTWTVVYPRCTGCRTAGAKEIITTLWELEMWWYTAALTTRTKCPWTTSDFSWSRIVDTYTKTLRWSSLAYQTSTGELEAMYPSSTWCCKNRDTCTKALTTHTNFLYLLHLGTVTFTARYWVNCFPLQYLL